MKDKNDGGPAFPSPAFDNCALPGCEGGLMRGMTLRDWFAGMALQGMLAGSSPDVAWPTAEESAQFAYSYADSLLAERSK